jgi:hypothetical protein
LKTETLKFGGKNKGFPESIFTGLEWNGMEWNGIEDLDPQR